jgi:peptide/nickel transport system substrate-binding protein
VLRPLALWFAIVVVGASCQMATRDGLPAFPRSGELRILLPAWPASLNPNLNLDETATVVGRSLFSHLVAIDENGQLLGELADTWNVSSDGLVYTFNLRKGVRWHDGVPLTAADVRWSYEQIGTSGFARAALAPVASIETPDASTVVIRLKHPWAPFATELTGFGLSILPEHVYGGRDWDRHAANDAPIGTGPFTFVSRDEATGTITLAANPRYFRTGPFVERVVFSVARDPQTALARLLSGEADYSFVRPPHTALAALATTPQVRTRFLPSTGRYYAALNLRRAPFQDARVRRALAAAIDRPRVVLESLGGYGAPAIGWYTPAIAWAYNAAARVPEYDVAAARRLLDDAGLRRGPDGSRFTLNLVVPEASPALEIGEFVAQAWRRVDVRVNVDIVSIGEFPSRLVVARDYDAALMTGGQGPDPDVLRQRFAQTGDADYIGYESEAFRTALADGAKTTEMGARARAYFRAQEVLARDVPFVPLADTLRVVTSSARVRGLPHLEAQGLVGFYDFSLVRLDGDDRRGSR